MVLLTCPGASDLTMRRIVRTWMTSIVCTRSLGNERAAVEDVAIMSAIDLQAVPSRRIALGGVAVVGAISASA